MDILANYGSKDDILNYIKDENNDPKNVESLLLQLWKNQNPLRVDQQIRTIARKFTNEPKHLEFFVYYGDAEKIKKYQNNHKQNSEIQNQLKQLVWERNSALRAQK